jgi:DNA-binding NarL/FixJ family response regulator
VNRLRPDVVLLDVGLPGLDGLACLEILRVEFPKTTVIMLSAADEPSLVQAALARGARAYILKTILGRDLASALRQVVCGTSCMTLPRTEPSVPAPTHGLSAREIDILRHIASGLSTKVIASKLCVADHTVKFHLTNIYRKLGVKNRTGAAREALRLGYASYPFGDAGVASRGTTTMRAPTARFAQRRHPGRSGGAGVRALKPASPPDRGRGREPAV